MLQKDVNLFIDVWTCPKAKRKLSDIPGHAGKHPWPTKKKNHLNFNLTCTGAEQPRIQASIFNSATVGLGQQKSVQISTTFTGTERPGQETIGLRQKII